MTDDDWAPVPQTGPIHLTMWTLLDGEPVGPGQVLGLSRWEDLLELAAKPGGIRRTYDLVDAPDDKGGMRRYRAMDVVTP
jgi:hypothetical protein